jgi:5-methylcytosine-specific restriction endonuclease McrA
MGDFHKTSAWFRLRREFKAHCKATNALCHICVARGDIENATIDYVRVRTPRSFEADHFRPVDLHPELALMFSNLRPAHVRCNRARGSKSVVVQQEWVKPDW